MLGKSWVEYIEIRLCIVGFLLVVPASLGYLGLSVFRRHFLLSPWLGLLALSECAFYGLVYLPRRTRLQKPAVHPPPLDRAERKALFERCAQYLSDDSYPTGWFFAPDIKRDNVVDWLLWALFSTNTNDGLPEWDEELDSYIKIIETMMGRKLENGRNLKVKSMRLTFDPVEMLHRPLIWYMLVMGVDIYASTSLMYLGLKHYATPKWFEVFPPRPTTLFSGPSVDPNISYWYRPHISKTKLPILFIHGIGIGLYPYIPFIGELIAQDPEVGILIIELLPICMHITKPLLPRPATCAAILNIINSLGLPRVVVASHSYGTIITAHMFHYPLLASRIAATLFIDPIPFLLHLPNVAYNFVYRQPHDANEWQLWYFASRDPDISRALSRHFFWAENVMWKEELEGKKVGVVLSGDDQIVHAQEVRKYLTGEGVASARWEKNSLQVLYYPGLDHAMVFDTKERRRPVLEVLDGFVRDI